MKTPKVRYRNNQLESLPPPILFANMKREKQINLQSATRERWKRGNPYNCITPGKGSKTEKLKIPCVPPETNKKRNMKTPRNKYLHVHHTHTACPCALTSRCHCSNGTTRVVALKNALWILVQAAGSGDGERITDHERNGGGDGRRSDSE